MKYDLGLYSGVVKEKIEQLNSERIIERKIGRAHV